MTAARFEVYRRRTNLVREQRGISAPADRPQFEGTVQTNGVTVITWLTKATSTCIFRSFGEMIGVHGHPEYETEVVWLDPSPFCGDRSRTICDCTCRQCGFGYHCGAHETKCHQNCAGDGAGWLSRPFDQAAYDQALAAFREAVAGLYIAAGTPPTRTVAAAIGGIGHNTVNDVVRGRKRLPRWRTAELVVEYLGGDVEHFRQLWSAAQALAR